jgi:hypothetical protein
MSPNLLASMVVLAFLLLTVGWVHLDASNHATAGEPVVFWSRTFSLETHRRGLRSASSVGWSSFPCICAPVSAPCEIGPRWSQDGQPPPRRRQVGRRLGGPGEKHWS